MTIDKLQQRTTVNIQEKANLIWAIAFSCMFTVVRCCNLSIVIVYNLILYFINCKNNIFQGIPMTKEANVNKTNPPTAVLSTQIKLYCYGVDYRAFAGAS